VCVWLHARVGEGSLQADSEERGPRVWHPQQRVPEALPALGSGSPGRRSVACAQRTHQTPGGASHRLPGSERARNGARRLGIWLRGQQIQWRRWKSGRRAKRRAVPPLQEPSRSLSWWKSGSQGGVVAITQAQPSTASRYWPWSPLSSSPGQLGLVESPRLRPRGVRVDRAWLPREGGFRGEGTARVPMWGDMEPGLSLESEGKRWAALRGRRGKENHSGVQLADELMHSLPVCG